MATERSDAVYGYWRESSEHFDYFVTGLTGALTAYIGQTLTPHRIDVSPESVALLALVIFVLSVILGFKRIETNVTIFKLMHQRLYSEEFRGALLATSQGKPIINASSGDVLSPGQVLRQAQEHQIRVGVLSEELDKLIAHSGSFYAWRNRSLVAGFTLLVASRLLPAYMT
jgi:hypothetical protein